MNTDVLWVKLFDLFQQIATYKNLNSNILYKFELFL
jgi:hypothetical protein